MRRLARLVGALAVAAAMSSCSSDKSRGDDNPRAPTPIGTSRRLLVVTHTEGFRHSSIPIAEATNSTLGQS